MAGTRNFNSALAQIRNIGASAKSGTSTRARIDVLTNGEAAASKDLAEGVFRVGSRADCDLIIPESRIPHLATIKIEKNARDEWTIILVPFVEGMRLDRAPIAAFNPVLISHAALLDMGSTMLRLTPVSSQGAFGTVLKNVGASVISARDQLGVHADFANGQKITNVFGKIPPRSILLLAGGLFLAALASSFWDVLRPQAVDSSNIALQGEEPRIEDGNELAAMLRRQLQTADLGDHIKVRLEAKKILLEGAVAERQEERYRSILNAARRRTRLELQSLVRPVATPAAMQIVGVALEPVSYIVLANGQRYQLGDTLPMDWQIEAITAKNVVLAKNGLREIVSLDAR